MTNSHFAVGALALLSLLAGCSTGMQSGGAGDAAMRQAQDTPARFTTADGTLPLPDDGCRVTIIDPRDQTSLRLARSAQFGMSHRGDYEVPVSRYGVQQGELLRVDCATGEAIGIVRAG
jgi:hypothetical protein